MNLFKHTLIAARGIRYAEKAYNAPVTPRAYSIGIVHALNGFGDGTCYLKRDPKCTPPSCFDRAKDAVFDELSRYEGMCTRDIALVAVNRLYRDVLLRKTRTKPLTANRADPQNPVASYVDDSGNDCPSSVAIKARQL